jgi:S-DNA-T family DNA segregation ATPase FtsK/SpoIIIE
MLINADVAGLVARIAQVGRTAGVHLVVTAQQPGARSLGDALTNFTARLLGRVATATQTYGAAGRARTMAERLLGHGDFLLLTAQDEVRLQIPWLDNRYLARIPHSDRVPTLEGELPTAVRLADLQRDPRGAPARRLGPADYQAIEAALVDGASVADLRGRFGIGYSRARRLHDLYWGLNGEDDEAGEEGGHHD